jgi:hypothetical protein
MAEGSVRAVAGMKIWVAAALMIVGACGAPAKPLPPPAVAPAPPPAPPPQAVAPRPPAPPSDSCGADALQYLVGKPRTEIPVPVNPGRRRVVCSTCAMTMDYQSTRQTIIYDSKTDLVSSVKCG